MPPVEQRRVQLTNVLALIAISLSLLYSAMYLVAGAHLSAGSNLAAAAGYLGAFALTGLRRPIAARVLLCTVYMAHIAALDMVFFSHSYGFNLYFILCGPIAFLIFGARQRLARVGVTVASAALYAVAQSVDSLALVGQVPSWFHTVTNLSTVPVIVGVLMLIQAVYVAEIEQREAALDIAARTDALTGLPNRAALFEQGRAMQAHTRRACEPFTAMMVDIDYFKRVNDAHGHATGDAVLARVAATLRGLLRTSDLVGRIGGEEFLVMTTTTDPAGVPILAERLRRGVEELVTPTAGGDGIRCTISIGVAAQVSLDPSLEALVARADRALYVAKLSGRNRVVVDGEPDEAPRGGATQPGVARAGL